MDPNHFLRYGSRKTMPSTWSTPEISDQDFYTGYGFAVINKRANRSVVLGKKFLYTDAKEEIIKKANEEGTRVIHPYLDLIRSSTDFSERDFWYDISTYLDLEGIYYLMAVRTVTTTGKVGNIQKFVLLNPYNIRPVVNSKGELGGYSEIYSNKQRDIPKEMIIPIKLLNPFKNDQAYSLADAARDSQFTMKQANDFAREAIDGNLNAPGILSSSIELPDDQFDNFVERVKHHGRGEPLFGNGAGTINWEDMQTDLDKAALDKINNINRDALIAVSGTSKTGMGIEESGTGREVSRTQKDDFTENAVMPQIENIIDALNLDYRKYYSDRYKSNGYTIVLDNPLETDRDAEQKDVEIRDSQFALLQQLLDAGYSYDVAAKYAKGLIEVTDIGKPEQPEVPEEPPVDETPTGDGEDPNEPDTPETPPVEENKATEVFEGYPIPLVQYLGDLADSIEPKSEKKSTLHLTEKADKVRIQTIELRDNQIIGVIDNNSYAELADLIEESDAEPILNELNKRYRNQLVAIRQKKDFNKDFYVKVPSAVKVLLDNLIDNYQDRHWFESAWNSYRDHIMNSPSSELKMPGYTFKEFTGRGSEDLIFTFVEPEVETHTHNFDKQEQIDSSTQSLLGAVQASESQILNWYLDRISEGQLAPGANLEAFANNLALPFAVWFTVMYPIFASYRVRETAKELDIADIPIVAMTEEMKAQINEFARKEAVSHVNTIRTDLENALAIIRTQTTDPTEIKTLLQSAFVDIQNRRAATIAQNASNRIFALSQYEADYQLLTRAGLIKRAYKQLYSTTGTPCPICSFIISETNAKPIPFTQPFVSVGSTIETEKLTMDFDYENVIAGNVHVNCRCYYKITIEEEKAETQESSLSVSDIVAEQLTPILSKLTEEKSASDATMQALSEMAAGLNEQINKLENKLDQLDKRTKEARQLKDALHEANDVKAKLAETEEYARQLENLLDGQ